MNYFDWCKNKEKNFADFELVIKFVFKAKGDDYTTSEVVLKKSGEILKKYKDSEIINIYKNISNNYIFSEFVITENTKQFIKEKKAIDNLRERNIKIYK